MDHCRYRALLSLAGLVLLFTPGSSFGQASLASEDRIDNVVVEELDAAFTVIRDAIREDQWYYLPDMPRLLERMIGEVKQPEFALIRYQFADPSDAEKPLERGVLQFAVELDIPTAAQTRLRQAIVDKTGLDRDKINLAPMPLKSAKVHMWTPGGSLIAVDTFGSGTAPTISTQKMVFSSHLTRVGADVLDALVQGNTGVPVAVEMVYNGLTPPAGFKVTVDWDQTYHHYSSNTRFRARAGGWFWSANFEYERQFIRNTLLSDKSIVVETIEGEALTGEQIDKYLQPILDRINSEILRNLEPPEQIDPARAPRPGGGGWFGGGGLSIAIKDSRFVKRGKETITFNRRQHVERITQASGFVGIGRYPDAIKADLVQEVPQGPWNKAYFLLPTVLQDPRLEISNAELEVKLVRGSSVVNSQVFRWEPQSGWRDRNGSLRSVALFPLLGITDRASLEFTSDLHIVQNFDRVTLTEATPVFNGEQAIASTGSFDIVGFDASLLNWRYQGSDEGMVAQVAIAVEVGGNRRSDTLRPRRGSSGLWTPPPPVLFILPRSEGPVKTNVVFVLTDGRRISWPMNGQDLRRSELYPDLRNIGLFDADWNKQ